MTLESDVDVRLGKLPKNLAGVYDEIMNSIKSRPGADFELATRALKWMLVSERPLEPEELTAATELNPSSTSLDYTPQPSSLDVELVIHVCGGLVLLDKQLNVMRFAHLSVREYLETRENSWGIIDAQRFILEGCLWTLQCEPSASLTLHGYAASNWFGHCRSYQDIVLSQSTYVQGLGPTHALDIPTLRTFLGSFDCASTYFMKWVEWLNCQRYPNDSIKYADANLCDVVPSKPLSPAFAAVACGLGELVSWLWHSEGADMKIRNDENESLLYLACRYGTTWIIECMLTRGVGLDINEVSSSGTALGGAACQGSLEIVTLLLDRGADMYINIVGGKYDTALGAAVYGGSLEIATLLLDRGADINIVGGKYGTALGAAAFWGSLEMATLLLDRGADINIVGGEYGTALGAAAYWGGLEMATLLLDRGADINIVGGVYGTALGAAVSAGDLAMATLLLDRGADINTVGGIFGTALGMAAFEGRLEMTTFLLDRGADIHIVGGESGTALGAAVFGGDLEELTMLLLDQGADIHIVGGESGTALGAAAFGGKLEIAMLLLDRGADINITFGGKYGTVLAAAVVGGNYNDYTLEVTTLLLARGANPDLTNNLGQKPRDLAELKGLHDIVSLLDSYSAGKTANQASLEFEPDQESDTQVPIDG